MNLSDQKVVENQNIAQVEIERATYHNLVDILFVLDSTSSMGWCMSKCKKTIKKIIKKFSEKQYNIKFAIELYRDHPPQEYSYVEKHFDLRNQQAILQVINKQCQVAGGGDLPEAVMDGLYQGIKKTSWRVSTDGKTKSKRFLFHGCDAPPHGKYYGSQSSDANWTQNGCPCKITRADIKNLIIENEVDYSLIKCGKQVDIMESLFKEAFEKRFKRVIQIEQNSGSRKKHKVRGSEAYQSGEECYMEQEAHHKVFQQYAHQMSQQQDQEIKQQKIVQSQKLGQQKTFFSSLKQKLGFKSKTKQAQKKVEKIQSAPKRLRAPVIKRAVIERKNSSSDSCDQEALGGLQRKRSMASLVCSQVESGIQDYFEKQQEKKQDNKPIQVQKPSKQFAQDMFQSSQIPRQ